MKYENTWNDWNTCCRISEIIINCRINTSKCQYSRKKVPY